MILVQTQQVDQSISVIDLIPEEFPVFSPAGRQNLQSLLPDPTTDPEKKKQELEAGKITLKTEKKAPLMHIVIGKTDMKDEQLVENITLLIKKINARKIAKLVLSATMSPGIKIDLSEFIIA